MKAVLLGATITAAAAKSSGKPNIVFFLADDMGYGDAGYLSTAPEERRLATPNLDKMVKTGMAFTDAYAGAPVCAPSRCTLITGRHTGHCTVRSNSQDTLSDEDVGVAQVLKKVGYRTVHIGKWGLGTFNQTGSPTKKGFDEYYGQLDQRYCHDYYPAYMDSNRNTSKWSREYIPQNKNSSNANCGPDHSKCLWSGDDWTNVATQWLKEEGQRQMDGTADAPFFMYLAYTTPHAGKTGSMGEGQPPVPRLSTGPYAKKGFGKEVGYATAVWEIDQKLGIYFDTLEKAGLQENTLTFFSSDNGASNEGDHDYQYFTSSGPLRGFKRALHEGGHRAATVVHWPGKVPGGIISSYQFAFWDFLATAADFAGVPANALPDHDGISAKPTMLGLPQQQRPFVYTEYCNPVSYPHPHQFGNGGWGQAVRAGNWSAVCIGHDLSSGKIPACDVPELYDLGKDIGQTTDVASKHPEVVEDLMNIMKREHQYGGDCGEKKTNQLIV